jgi:hypothetical protein
MNPTVLAHIALTITCLRFTPGSTESVRRDIELQYAKRSRAIVTHEVRGVLDVLAPGFSMHYVQGSIAGRKEWEDGLRARMAELATQAKRAKDAGGEWKNPESVSTVLQKIAVHGDRATVTAQTTTKNRATYPHGVAYTATLEETSEDTWVRTALGWRLLTIEQLHNRTMTDEVRTAAPKPKQ